MKNVTVSLPDEVYRKARIKAAERNVSLSSLVRRYLESLAEEEGEFKRLERLQEESYAKIERFSASDRIGCLEVLTEDLRDQQSFYGVRAVNPFKQSLFDA